MQKITKKELEKAIENFKNTVIGPSKINKLDKIQDNLSIKTAVELAYNDARRTMARISKTEKDVALEGIIEAFNKYFKKQPPDNIDLFNQDHHDICEKWCTSFPNDSLGAYGKAQKIVNMAFKYLYCCSDQKNYIKYFEYCHMPLDSFTLEWIKRQKKLSSKKITAWSNLQYGSQNSQYFEDNKGKEYYSYLFYINQIQDIIKDNQKDIGSHSALELEFVIWPQIRLEKASEAFYFTLMEELTNKDKEIFRSKDPKDKLDAIRDFLNASTIEQP